MPINDWILLAALGFSVFLNLIILIVLIVQNKRSISHQELTSLKDAVISEQQDLRHSILNQMHESNQNLLTQVAQLQTQLQQSLLAGFKDVNDSINQQQVINRDGLSKSLKSHAQEVSLQIEKLNSNTEMRLDKMSDRMNEKLSQGFEKSIQTFNDILQRLAMIDEAQKKISELSSNVVSLQSVLSDKRSRGAFGEVQLYSLLENVLASGQFKRQATLSNSKIADAILEMPEPTGRIVIDSKFPLESYQRMTDNQIGKIEQLDAIRQFKQDVKKHIKDIATKYIIKNETADSAILFLPAEAIFAEIHAHHNDLVELAWQSRVWLTSPTTLMAILTTAKAVLKDDATRKQVHVIQQHLIKLNEDFQRFGGRFDQLSRHINQAATDVKQIHISAQKITGRFASIENLQIEDELINLEQKGQ